MIKKLTATEQEQLFTTECKLINLKYEYQGYTGDEKWAIVSELTEKELSEKYPDIIGRYTPFVLLSIEQGKVITEANNVDAKYRMRYLRTGHIFDLNDGAFEEHHPELAVVCDIVEKLQLEEDKKILQRGISSLNEVQKRRLIAYFFKGKSYARIASEENVSHQAVKYSIEAAIKNLKIFFDSDLPFASPGSNK